MNKDFNQPYISLFILFQMQVTQFNKNLAKKYFGKSCELGNDEDCQIYNAL